MTKERNLTYDLIRAISCFFVVCIHCSAEVEQMHDTQGFSLGGDVLWFTWHHIINAAVPMFCMLSGALLLGGKITPPQSFLQRRLRRIIIPFVFWTIALFVLRVFKEHWTIDGTLFLKFCKMLLSDGVMGIYWFVYMIIGLYFITPLIHPYFKNADKKSINYAVILLLGFYILRGLWKDDIIWVARFTWNYYYCFTYFIMGYAITHYYQQASWFKKVSRIMLVVTFALNMWYDLVNEQINQMLLFFFSISLFANLVQIKISPSKTPLRLLLFVSGASYAVYLSHAAFVSAVGMTSIKETVPICIMPFVWGVCAFTLVCICQYVIKKMHLDRWLW